MSEGRSGDNYKCINDSTENTQIVRKSEFIKGPKALKSQIYLFSECTGMAFKRDVNRPTIILRVDEG